MPLITDYRPDEFEEFIGCKDTIKIITSKLLSKNRPHSYLITGPSGCGKTTLARIMAKEFGAVDEFHYIEYNASDFRGIDIVRAMKAQSILSPVGRNKARVWLLDEAHGLTAQAQEGILKLLEDPPGNSYYILCTTEPQKLKPTLKRRCTKLSVEPLKEEEVLSYLDDICCEERGKDPFTEEVYEAIFDKSDGSLGRALDYLEEVIDLNEDEALKKLRHTEHMDAHGVDLARALIQGSSWKKISNIIKQLRTDKANPESVRYIILDYCYKVLLSSKNQQAFLIMACFRESFSDSPFPLLTAACYDVIAAE